MWPLCAGKQAEELTEKVPAEEEAIVGTGSRHASTSFPVRSWFVLNSDPIWPGIHVRRVADVRERTKTKKIEIETS